MRQKTEHTKFITGFLSSLNDLGNGIKKDSISDLNKATSLLVKCLQLAQQQDFQSVATVLSGLLSEKLSESSFRALYKCINYAKDNVFGSFITGLYSSFIQSPEFNTSGKVVITMTSCKRLDLLQRTINSMLNCITDFSKVKEWVVVDDNSSQTDRDKMQQMWPFIRYVFKTPEQKGHPKSMNIIRDIVVNSGYNYVFHIEDDFEFFVKRDYITELIELLDVDKSYGQALVNLDYGEDPITASDIAGSKMEQTQSGKRYFIHNYYTGSALEAENRKLQKPNSMYWPHFSFRPGLTRSNVFKQVGKFTETNDHFEREYALRYIQKGFKTVFLDAQTCVHIGRRTYERSDPGLKNAYDLNNEVQFASETNKKPQETKAPISKGELMNIAPVGNQIMGPIGNKMLGVYLMNLERRPDRLVKFFKENLNELPPLKVFKGVDGSKLTPDTKLQQMFETGDYGFRRGIVGCAYTHIKIWKEFIETEFQDYCLVLEDDAKLANGFCTKLFQLLEDNHDAFDLMFLHYLPWPHARNPIDFYRTPEPKAELWSREDSIARSMGSGTAYILSRRGARNLLQHIKQHGVYNGIDWVMFKTGATAQEIQSNSIPESANRVMYSRPMIAYAECVQDNNRVDSDIQKDYSTVGFASEKDWLQYEIQYWINKLKVPGYAIGDSSGFSKMFAANVSVGKVQKASAIVISEKWSPDYSGAVVFCSKEQNAPDTFATYLVEWYVVASTIVVVPHAFLTDLIISEKCWRGSHLNPLFV